MKKLKIIGIIVLLAAIAFLVAGCGNFPCPACDGSGTCFECNGEKYTIEYSYDYYTNTSVENKVPCFRCDGTGICSTCKGTGKVNIFTMMGSDSSSSDSDKPVY